MRTFAKHCPRADRVHPGQQIPLAPCPGMRFRTTAPIGGRNRADDIDALPKGALTDAVSGAVNDAPVLRALTVEHLEGTPQTPSGKAILRLKGKWLAAVFSPGTRVYL